MSLSSFATPALAKKCSASGGLLYVGNTANAARSVWLSGTSAGSFKLEAAQGSQVVDVWNKSKRGLRLSLSPVVSNGNGGTHKLLDTSSGSDCLLATQNQKGGITLPPISELLPGFQRPPQGLMPTLPGAPPQGLMPTLPGGVAPPIGTLPPEGVMPTLPGGVTPPIGTLPPEGVMPTLPGGVAPPIGTLPPEGVMPTLPGGVAPPIGTLPPEGVMPTLPGGVAPPIGTLPPEGVTPTLPGGVTPPVGTLPPEGVTPTLPGGVTPPIATLPPEGVTPTLPGTVAPPVGGTTDPGSGIDSDVPLTPGREFYVEPLWNVWTTETFDDTQDSRFGLDTSSQSGTAIAGADRLFGDNLVAGFMVGLEGSRTEGFDGSWKTESAGFLVGPYAAYRVTENWALQGSFTYSQFDNEQEIVILQGDYESREFGGSVGVTGQYQVNGVYLRPSLMVNYTHTWNDGYSLSGFVLGVPISVPIAKSSTDEGSVELTGEISRAFDVSDHTILVPYAELGAEFDFLRPNDGKILSADLTEESTTPVSMSLRAGLRMLFDDAVYVDVGGGYLSLGEQDLDVWEGQMRVSVGF